MSSEVRSPDGAPTGSSNVPVAVSTRRLALTIGLSLIVVLVFGALATARDLPENPMFIRWLKAEDPSDETIRVYWDKVKSGEASPEEMVDLGSMLYLRGYPKDALRLYRRALDENDKLYEAWFRIGLVEHREGNLRAARRAYKKCLTELTGHGWCNFYMGLLQEQLGNPKKALNYYRRAFKFAPALADPKVNPELLYSKLQLGAVLRHNERQRFTTGMPMSFLQPEQVAEVEARFIKEPASEAAAAQPLDLEQREVSEEPGEGAAQKGPDPAKTSRRSGARPTPVTGLREAPDTSTVVDSQRRRSPIQLDGSKSDATGSDEPAQPPPPPRRGRRPTPRSVTPPQPSPTPVPGTKKPDPIHASGGGYPPQVGGASPEARLLPLRPGRLERMALEIGGPGSTMHPAPYFPPQAHSSS